MDIPVDHQSLYLGELMAVGRIVTVPSVHFSGTDDLDRALPFFCLHRTGLYRRSVRTEQDILGKIEAVLHIPCRVGLWQVQCLEIEIVRFNFIAFGNLVAETDEEILDILYSTAQWMRAAESESTAGKRNINCFLLESRLERFIRKYRLLLFDHRGDMGTHFVDSSAVRRTVFIRKILHLFHQTCHFPLFT